VSNRVRNIFATRSQHARNIYSADFKSNGWRLNVLRSDGCEPVRWLAPGSDVWALAMPLFYIYLCCFDFRKINGQIKISKNIHLASNPTAAGTPATVRHGIRGGVNGQLYCQVGLDSCRRGARRQES
jgi:hypothetical protein